MNEQIRAELSRSFSLGLNSLTARLRNASSFVDAILDAIHRSFIEPTPPNSPGEDWPKMVNNSLSLTLVQTPGQHRHVISFTRGLFADRHRPAWERFAR